MDENDGALISNIILTGMPGAYKTSAGRILAESLDMHFMDTDEFFEFEYACKMTDCIAKYGRDVFRDLEAKIVDRIYYFSNTVIATGGDVCERDDNMEKLKRHGPVVYLTCDVPVLARRLKKTRAHPALDGGRPRRRALRKLFEARRDMFLKYADITVDNTELNCLETAAAVRDGILKFYGEK